MWIKKCLASLAEWKAKKEIKEEERRREKEGESGTRDVLGAGNLYVALRAVSPSPLTPR